MGAAGDVRCGHHVLKLQQRMIGRRRFDVEHIQAGAGDPLLAQRLQQVILIVDQAAGGIDEIGRRLHPREGGGIEQVDRFLRARAMHRDKVRPGQQFGEVHLACAARGDLFFGQVGIAGDHLHVERVAEFRCARADPAEPDNADGLVPDVVAHQLVTIAGAIAQQGAIGQPHLLRQRQDEPDRVFRHRFVVGAALAADDHAGSGAGIDIDDVVTGAGGAQGQHVRAARQQRGVAEPGLHQLRSRTDMVAAGALHLTPVRRRACAVFQAHQFDVVLRAEDLLRDGVKEPFEIDQALAVPDHVRFPLNGAPVVVPGAPRPDSRMDTGSTTPPCGACSGKTW